MSMDSALRLYMESVMRVGTAANPSGLSDDELLGCVGLLPTPAVDFTSWQAKLGISTEKKPRGLTDEEKAAINDKAIEVHKAMEKRKNG